MEFNVSTASSREEAVLTELLSETLRAEIDSDSIIPDTTPDVEAVLLCEAFPRLDEPILENGIVTLNGTVRYQVLLLTEGGVLTNLGFNEPFTLKKEVPGASDDAVILAVPTLDYAAAKLVNPRKLHLRSQTNVDLRVWEPICPCPEIRGAETLDDDMNLQRKLCRIPTAVVLSASENDIPVSTDIELTSGDPPAAEIVSVSVFLTPSEVKPRGETTDVRLEASLTALYRSEEGNYFTAGKKMPLEQTVAIAAADCADWIANAVPGPVNAAIAANGYGEMKTLEIDFTYDLVLYGFCRRTVEGVSDMFSTEFHTETESAAIPVTRLHRTYSTGLSVNASFDRSGLTTDHARDIFTGTAVPKDLTVTADPARGKITVEGKLDITLVIEGAPEGDSETNFTSIRESYPFRCELDAGDLTGNETFIPSCFVTGLRFRMDQNTLYADIELCLRVLTLQSEKTVTVSAVDLDRTRPASYPAAPIVLCYPTHNETLWDIAKLYRVTEAEIKEANHLDSADITGKAVLLIPKKQTKKAAFSGIV